jgi:hypothetical protein
MIPRPLHPRKTRLNHIFARHREAIMLKSRTSTTEIPRTIAEDSFFNIKNHSAKLSNIAAEDYNLRFPLLLNSFMRRSPTDETLADRSRTIKIGLRGDSFDWLSEIDPSVWETLLVRNYELAELTEHRRQLLHDALEHLYQHHPESYEYVRTFVKLIGWLVVTDDSEVRISSGSAPTLPYAVFVSDVGVKEIPPKTSATKDSARLLAENLLHEATHQRITFHLLEHPVLAKGYDTKTAKKIDIGWRKGQNKWEPDRALHASIVYNEILRYRMRELRDLDCDESARQAFYEGAERGTKAITFLTESLLDSQEYFTEYGMELIETQAVLASAVATEWEASHTQLR